MNDFRIYENRCKEDIINKLQLDKKHTEYSIGKTLYATSDRGKKAYQDDSAIILEHPINKNIKLIAVADGIGSSIDGNLASNHVIKKLIEWFENIEDFDTNKTNKSLQEMLKHVLKDLKANIYAATTLSAAIVLENKTLIENIGDSRIYTIRNNKLNQRTRDDSEVQSLLEENVIPNKELARFHKASNILLEAIAFYPEDYHIKYKIINNDYEKLLLTTDGVTDCLSTKQIENIIKSSKDGEITKNIVKNAIEIDSYLENIIKEQSIEEYKAFTELQEITENDYNMIIKGGKDNATAAVYIRK